MLADSTLRESLLENGDSASRVRHRLRHRKVGNQITGFDNQLDSKVICPTAVLQSPVAKPIIASETTCENVLHSPRRRQWHRLLRTLFSRQSQRCNTDTAQHKNIGIPLTYLPPQADSTSTFITLQQHDITEPPSSHQVISIGCVTNDPVSDDDSSLPNTDGSVMSTTKANLNLSAVRRLHFDLATGRNEATKERNSPEPHSKYPSGAESKQNHANSTRNDSPDKPQDSHGCQLRTSPCVDGCNSADSDVVISQQALDGSDSTRRPDKNNLTPCMQKSESSFSYHNVSRHFSMLYRESVRRGMPVPVWEGWLTKQGGMRKTWRRRWCILDNSGAIRYYKPREYIPRGVVTPSRIYLKSNGMVIGAGTRAPIPSCPVVCATAAEKLICWPSAVSSGAMFAVHTPSRTFYFYADSGPEASKWTTLITRFCCDKVH